MGQNTRPFSARSSSGQTAPSSKHGDHPWTRVPTHIFAPPHPLNPGFQVRHYHQGRSTTESSNSDAGIDKEQSEERKADSPSRTPSSSSTSPSSLPTTSDDDLPHLTPSKKVHMTQITSKPETHRLATATCLISFSNPKPTQILHKGQGTQSHKGDVFSVARIAGIMAAKRTPDIVPLCHPGIGITGVEVDASLLDPVEGMKQQEHGRNNDYGAMRVVATVTCLGRTGVEMEAMTATVGAALTVYDMLKAVDKGMVIGEVQLQEKTGGKSGRWSRSS